MAAPLSQVSAVSNLELFSLIVNESHYCMASLSLYQHDNSTTAAISSPRLTLDISAFVTSSINGLTSLPTSLLSFITTRTALKSASKKAKHHLAATLSSSQLYLIPKCEDGRGKIPLKRLTYSQPSVPGPSGSVTRTRRFQLSGGFTYEYVRRDSEVGPLEMPEFLWKIFLLPISFQFESINQDSFSLSHYGIVSRQGWTLPC